MSEVTPIRADLKLPAPPKKIRRNKRDERLESLLVDIGTRLYRATSLVRVVADDLEDATTHRVGAHPQDSVLGIADLLDSIIERIDSIDLKAPQEKRP
jgi:hypothetical protein